MREETRLMDRKSVDIIIPIYNALDDLKMCIDSVQKYTDLTRDNLILINDNSSDSQIKVYLDSLTLNNTTIIHNETNRGFSYNVNKGMSLSSDNDVILLNSDTIVTKNWVDKIYTCAYSDESIGTVTPLSNSATLCSIPNMCQDNKIPEGLSVDDMARIVEECSIQEYPRITVAVGFCMFIKREVLNITGLFDAETFEKGYGEENDFCNRAEQYGYIHVMCDDTFIYHKGTASFDTSNKKELLEAHEKYLMNEYPEQMKTNTLYCQENPEQYIRDNINVFIDLANGKKNLLYMSHLDFRSDAYGSIGGTQYHLKSLVDSTEDIYNVFTLTRDDTYLLLSVYANNHIHTYRFYIGEIDNFFTFHSKQLKELFELILDTFKINIVHIHHVLGLSLDMFHAASTRNITLITTIHDFFCLSPAYKLLDKNYNYIQPDNDDKELWKDAISSFAGYSNKVNILPLWQKNFKEALELCNKIIYPHESCMEIVLSVYPNLRDKSIVIEHGIDFTPINTKTIAKSSVIDNPLIEGNIDYVDLYENKCLVVDGWAIIPTINSAEFKEYIAYEDPSNSENLILEQMEKYARKDTVSAYKNNNYLGSGFRGFSNIDKTDGIQIIIEHNNIFYSSRTLPIAIHKKETSENKRRIAFFGGMVPEKGSKLIYEMIKNSDPDIYEWFIFGSIGDDDLMNLSQDNLHKAGPYSRDYISTIIKGCNIDLVCILSIWPETFCYIISESVYCNIPILTTDIGAQGARTTKNGYGITVPYNSTPSDILHAIDNLFSNREEYTHLKENATQYKEKDVDSMCSEYIDLYKDSYIGNESFTDRKDNKKLLLAMTNSSNYVWMPKTIYKDTESELSNLKEKLTDTEEKLRNKETELVIIKNSRIYKSMIRIKKLLRRN